MAVHHGRPGLLGRWAARLLEVPVVLYQKVVSPLVPPSCRYTPSCSHYMRGALVRHGPLKGLLLGLARILRCNGLFRGGRDTVPAPLGWGYLLRRIVRDYRRRWEP